MQEFVTDIEGSAAVWEEFAAQLRTGTKVRLIPAGGMSGWPVRTRSARPGRKQAAVTRRVGVLNGKQEATLRQAAVLGHQMAYVETGTGRPIALLHGNPHGVLPVPLGAAHPRLALPNPVRRGTG